MNNKIASMVRHTLVAVALIAPSAAAFAAEPGVSPDEIVIGQSITLQGGKNRYGVEVAAGIQSYLRAVNQSGGVNGRRVVLRTLDDENQVAKADANARQLIQSGVFVLFGSIEGGPSVAVMKAAVEQKVPFFGPMAGSPELRRPAQPLVFPVRAEHREEFRELIGYGTKTGLMRLGFFHADSETGRKHLENVRLASAEKGVELALALPIKSDIGDAQLDAMVMQMKEARVDMMLNHGSAGLYERHQFRLDPDG
jgi:ABC-type branched-subunit amino acid transport system substrate-binding protein